jgi:hypothetical protein
MCLIAMIGASLMLGGAADAQNQFTFSVCNNSHVPIIGIAVRFRHYMSHSAKRVVVVALAGQAYALDTDDAFDRARARKEKGCLPAFGKICSSIRTQCLSNARRNPYDGVSIEKCESVMDDCARICGHNW